MTLTEKPALENQLKETHRCAKGFMVDMFGDEQISDIGLEVVDFRQVLSVKDREIPS